MKNIKKVVNWIGLRFTIVLIGLFIWFFVYERKAQEDYIKIESQNNSIKAREQALHEIDLPIWEKDLKDVLLFYNQAYLNRVFIPIFGDTCTLETFKNWECDRIFGEGNNLFAENDSTALKLKRGLDFIEWTLKGSDTIFFEVHKYPTYNIDSTIDGIGGFAKIIN